jgi:Uma2 family endonuclease
MATVSDARTLPYGPRDAGIPLNADEFEAADFQHGWRYELIHGVLVVSPSPREEERDANEQLGFWLRAYQQSERGNLLDLTLPEQDLRVQTHIRRCDRAIWCGLGRLPRTRGRVAERDPPAIVIEFPSSRPADQRRDYEEKAIEYRDLGVKEYWILDRFRRSMTAWSWKRGTWSQRLLSEKQSYQTPLLPGFRLSLRALFAISDRYPSDD